MRLKRKKLVRLVICNLWLITTFLSKRFYHSFILIFQAAINDCVVALRSAIFTPTGRDKDVTEGIAPAFMKYDRNGLDLIIEFSAKLQRKESEWAFELVKNNMEEIYDASGYGWDDDDKRKELTEQVVIFSINQNYHNLLPFFLI